MAEYNDLKNRTLFAIFYVIIMLVVFYFGANVLKIFFSIISFFLIYEISKQTNLGYLYIIFIPLTILNIFITNLNVFFSVLILIFFITPLFFHFVIDHKISSFKKIIIFLLLFFYINIGIKFTILTSMSFGNMMAIFILISIWIYDNFAYLLGIKLGKNHIFKYLSPKKSLEGVIAGVFYNLVLGGTLGILYYFFFRRDELNGINFFIIFFKLGVFSMLIGITAQFGDLYESYFKRYLKIKDFSNILGGHGGFLDRFDSILFVFPIIYIILTLL